MSLKQFLEQSTGIVDRVDRLIYSGSLLDSVSQERAKTGKSIEAIKKRVEPFFESCLKFSEWVKLSEKNEWEQQIKHLYEEQQ